LWTIVEAFNLSGIDQFIHLPLFQVIIRRKCQFAVLPSQIDTHFSKKPEHALERANRQRIIEEAAKIDGLIRNERALRQIQLPFRHNIRTHHRISTTKK
jgi:hypothetical protein